MILCPYEYIQGIDEYINTRLIYTLLIIHSDDLDLDIDMYRIYQGIINMFIIW